MKIHICRVINKVLKTSLFARVAVSITQWKTIGLCLAGNGDFIITEVDNLSDNENEKSISKNPSKLFKRHRNIITNFSQF